VEEEFYVYRFYSSDIVLAGGIRVAILAYLDSSKPHSEYSFFFLALKAILWNEHMKRTEMAA